MTLFRHSKKRDPDYDFFDRFGDPDKPSAGEVPPTSYPDIALNPATQIRIVQVLQGAFEDEVCCRLDVKALTDPVKTLDVPFSALSYTWGGFANPASITLNGMPGFPVSQNLYCFLQRFRSTDKRRWLWIDQICINQHDKKEKSLQVPLMTDIYSRAAEVIVWLGDHAPGAQLTSSRSHQLEKIIEFASFGRKDMGLCWWRRLWVLQEFSLASKEPVVQIGSQQIPWTDLCQFTSKFLEGVRSTLSAATSFSVLNDMIERFSAVRNMSQENRTLVMLAWAFPQLICFDPRDKIYGLLGLLAPAIKAVIRPDYEHAKVENVFSHATYAEILHTKSLGFLALVRYKPITASLPTWAVDFVYPQDLEHLDLPVRMDSWLEFFQKSSLSWIYINHKTEAEVDYDALNASLTITGLDLDKVLITLPIIDARVKDVPQTTSWMKLALTTTNLTSKLILKKEERIFRQQVLAPLDLQTAYQRLLSGDQAYSLPPSHGQSSIRRVLAEVIITDWLCHDSHADNDSVMDELGEDDALPAALEGYFDHLASDFETSGLSTSFCVTSKGFVGIGPRHMRCGDQIILPHGSRYPMLLRSNDDSTWKFLSFIHVTGLKNNQLRTLLPSLNLRENRYVLK